MGGRPYRLQHLLVPRRARSRTALRRCAAAAPFAKALRRIPSRYSVLTAGIDAPLSLPHSRWNDLPIEALRESGYTILSSSDATGADTFTRQRRSLFLCFQGHPEYEDVTLLKEYRRDVGRFLRGEQASYPLQPRGYFSPAASAALDEFRERALKGARPELLAQFPTTAAAQDLRAPWAGAAARIYRNWLAYIAAAARPGASVRRRAETGTAVH
jgi:homoserine O-succinyltransferase